MDKDILECALKRNWKDTSLEKVVSIESAPAVGKNLNYLSTVNRLNLKVVLGNGRVANKSLVAKLDSDSSELKSVIGNTDIFKTEIATYDALKQMEYLMEDYEDTEDVLWCRMVHHIPYSCIVMEDLQAKGFNMIDRVQFFDKDHIMLAVHSLGRYHGMLKALEVRGLAPKGWNTYYFFEMQGIQDCMYWEIIALAEAVKRLWDPSWTPIVEKIKTTKAEVYERLKKFREVDETIFNVTNHGDCQKNNILIKYNWNKKPIAMRFLDFQLIHYGSPCIDLTYTLYLAAYPSVRRANYDLLLRTYHNALVSTLDKYDFQGSKPDLDEIKEGMEKYYFMGMLLSLTWYPRLLKSERMYELRDFAKIAETDGKEGYSDENFYPEDLEKEIGPDIKSFVDRFYQDN